MFKDAHPVCHRGLLQCWQPIVRERSVVPEHRQLTVAMISVRPNLIGSSPGLQVFVVVRRTQFVLAKRLYAFLTRVSSFILRPRRASEHDDLGIEQLTVQSSHGSQIVTKPVGQPLLVMIDRNGILKPVSDHLGSQMARHHSRHQRSQNAMR